MTLPRGFRVRLADGVRVSDRSSVLIGGSPLVVFRLSVPAQRAVEKGIIEVVDDGSAMLGERLLATNLGVPDLTHQPAASAADLSVVVPVRDRPEQLARALASVQPLACIVVDDASRDPASVAAVVREYGARLVSLDANVGPAGARNAGVAVVATPFVAFVDSDVAVSAAALLALTRHFADPAVTVVGPKVSGITRTARPAWFQRFDATKSSLCVGDSPGVVRPRTAVAWLPAACLVARTDAVCAGFDPTLEVGEDVDLIWRLVGAGHRVRYDPTVVARHDVRPTIGGWLGRKFVYGTSCGPLARRHGLAVSPALLSPAYAVAAAAVLTRSSFSVPVAAVALVRGARSVRSALPVMPHRTTTAFDVAARGLGWAVRQESALLLRHWWPLAVVGACTTRPVRRALGTALLLDLALIARERKGADEGLGIVATFVAQRLDDIAYGGGLWYGVARTGGWAALLPRSNRKKLDLVEPSRSFQTTLTPSPGTTSSLK